MREPAGAGGDRHTGQTTEGRGRFGYHALGLVETFADVADDGDDRRVVLGADRVGRLLGSLRVAPTDRNVSAVGRECARRFESHAGGPTDDQVSLVADSEVHAVLLADAVRRREATPLVPAPPLRALVHRILEHGADPHRIGGLDSVRDEDAFHHVVEGGLERPAPQPHRHDRATGVPADRASRAGDAGRATERGNGEAGGVRGRAEAPGGIGEAQRRKVFHVAQHRAGV